LNKLWTRQRACHYSDAARRFKAGQEVMEKSMNASKRTAIAAATVACVALLSFSWSEQRGVSLGFASAQGADRSTVAPRSVVARRHYRRPDYGQGLFADAVAATTSPYYIYDDYYCYGDPSAARGYPAGGYYYGTYPGGYCVNRNATALYAQPTLFPRYYGNWSW
jgi:hypothetical protein